MLPNFLIIGAQKAASTWLSEMLRQHPDVFLYEAGEVHFFDAHFDMGLRWYESHFTSWSGQRAAGEKTPEYLTHPLAAERIRSTLGNDTRLIVSLRHPVDRAYSAYWHGMRHGRIPADTDFIGAFRRHEQLRLRGMYGEHLSRFLRYFPRDRLLVLIFEEMMEKRHAGLASCFRFLGVDSGFVPAEPARPVNTAKDVAVLSARLHALRRSMNYWPSFVKRPLVELGRRGLRKLPTQRNYAPLSSPVRQELVAYFADDMRVLEVILDRDLSIWNNPR